MGSIDNGTDVTITEVGKIEGFSHTTLDLLLTLLDGVTIKANAPDFLDLAQRIALARLELTAALSREGKEN